MQLTKYVVLATLLTTFAAAPLAGAMAAKVERKAARTHAYDTNKDGVVTQAEYIAASTERFKALDANKDGKITKEEFAKARDDKRKVRAQRIIKAKSMNRKNKDAAKQ